MCFGESGSHEAECSGRRAASAIRSLVNVRKCDMVLHESLLVPVLMYGSEIMMWRKKERSTDGQPQRFAGYQKNE